MPDGSLDDLSAVNSVAAAYQHRDKWIDPQPALLLPGSRLKWYDLAAHETPVPGEVRERARVFLQQQTATGALAIGGELGFATLHRCGASFYFLLVSTWRNENELWESVYALDGADAEFRPFLFSGTHRGTFCVWELGVVWHEQQAWRRYLRSARRVVDRHAWLGDQFEGAV